MNLFDLAPSEMTNSAVWAWILNGLHDQGDTSRKSLATRILLHLQIPVPDIVHTIQTERARKILTFNPSNLLKNTINDQAA